MLALGSYIFPQPHKIFYCPFSRGIMLFGGKGIILVFLCHTSLCAYQLQHCFCRVNNAGIMGIIAVICAVCLLSGYKPVGKARRQHQAFGVVLPVGLKSIDQNSDKRGNVLYSFGNKPWLYTLKIEHTRHYFIEYGVRRGIKRRIGIMLFCKIRRVKAIPAFAMGCCVRRLIQHFLPRLFQIPIPWLSAKENRSRSFFIRGFKQHRIFAVFLSPAVFQLPAGRRQNSQPVIRFAFHRKLYFLAGAKGEFFRRNIGNAVIRKPVREFA